MSIRVKEFAAPLLLLILLITGCRTASSPEASSGQAPGGTNAESPQKTTAAETSAKSSEDGTIASGTGTEKEKPAAGKGNLQGKVFYNDQPVEGIEVKLCETYSQFLSGCGGETFSAKTDAQGEYLIRNVTPRIYQGLIARVFNTNYYVFATSGIISAAKYNIEEGKTFFAPDTKLFKQDLKVASPKAGSKIDAENIEVKWEAYPEAAFYKFSLFADSSTGAKSDYDYINRRVDGSSYVLDKPLSPGTYTCRVEAFNGNGTKLAQSPADIKFTVMGRRATESATPGQ